MHVSAVVSEGKMGAPQRPFGNIQEYFWLSQLKEGTATGNCSGYRPGTPLTVYGAQESSHSPQQIITWPKFSMLSAGVETLICVTYSFKHPLNCQIQVLESRLMLDFLM